MKMQEKKILHRLKNMMLGLFVALLCFQIEFISVSADNEKVISSTTDGSSIYLYIKGVSNITGGTVQIGNRVCEDISIADMNVFSPPMRTVILIDNSYSIKSDKRPEIENILIQIVDQSISGEEYRIGVFSDTITWLSDYSSDYESVKNIISDIQYENQDTYFSDCLYSILEEMGNSENPVYSRIVMVSDGADEKSIGYTNYEVSALVEKSNIPIYMIGTPGDNTALETMFSFARASKADYYLLDNSVANEDVVAGILSDHELICMRITPNVDLLDGSQKNVQVTLDTSEGEIRLTASVNMPFATGSVDRNESEINEEQDNPMDQDDEQPSLPSLGGSITDAKSDEEKDKVQGRGVLPFLIIGFVVVLAAIACIVIIVIVRKKKKTNIFSSDNSSQAAAPTEPAISHTLEEDDKTQFIVQRNVEDSESTRMLLGQSVQTVWLVLKSLDRPGTEFRVPIQDVIQIGRKNADIVIDYDQCISTKQCEIIKRGELIYIKDLGSLNGTFYENIRILDQEIPIVDGGTIQLGNSKFTVMIVKQ